MGEEVCSVCGRNYIYSEKWKYTLHYGVRVCSYKCLQKAKARHREDIPSADVIRKMKEMRAGHMKLKEIAAKTGFSMATVYKYTAKVNEKKHSPTMNGVSIMRTLREDGMRLQDIAEHTGYAVSTVHNYLKLSDDEIKKRFKEEDTTKNEAFLKTNAELMNKVLDRLIDITHENKRLEAIENR